MILRVTMQITDGALGKLEANGTNGRMTGDYTGNHIAIFECELKHPPVLALAELDMLSIILSTRLNFQNWRLVDMDNFMKGNPPYSDFVTQVDWENTVDEIQRPGKFIAEEEPPEDLD